jgi:hypothetical protein
MRVGNVRGEPENMVPVKLPGEGSQPHSELPIAKT